VGRGGSEVLELLVGLGNLLAPSVGLLLGAGGLIAVPIVQIGLARFPTAHTVSNWLKQFTQATLAPAIQLNHDLVVE
jgi:hypothetical protein